MAEYALNMSLNMTDDKLALLEEISTMLPKANDTRILKGLGYYRALTGGGSGNVNLSCTINFKNSVDRDNVLTDIKSAQGMKADDELIKACMVDSGIITYTTFNDEGNEQEPEITLKETA